MILVKLSVSTRARSRAGRCHFLEFISVSGLFEAINAHCLATRTKEHFDRIARFTTFYEDEHVKNAVPPEKLNKFFHLFNAIKMPFNKNELRRCGMNRSAIMPCCGRKSRYRVATKYKPIKSVDAPDTLR